MKSERRYSSTTRRFGGLGKTRFGPVLLLLACLALFGGFAVAAYFIAPQLYTKFMEESDLGCIRPSATPSVQPTAEPTPSPTPLAALDNPLYGIDLAAAQQEIVVAEYQYLSDFSVYGDTLVYVAGNYTQSGTAAFVRVVTTDLVTRKSSYLAPPQQYKSLRYPRLSEQWLAYVDVNDAGGGRVMAYELATGTAKLIKTCHVGVPVLSLWEHYLVFIERTGSVRDKLFVCDLESGEQVTLEIYDSSEFGLSAPCVKDGLLVYADPKGKLTLYNLRRAEQQKIDTGGYVHDPKTDGTLVAWLDGNHGLDTRLMYLKEDGSVAQAAVGVVDFSVGDGFLYYNINDLNYVYFPESDVTFELTRSSELAQLLCAGSDYIVWMDVTWRDKDILEYMKVR